MDILIGLQWGDEGKGKFIDLIGQHYDVVARFNGGANAGHSIFYQNKKITLKALPSGIFYPNIKNIIGSGVVLDPVQFVAEIEQIKTVAPALHLNNNLLMSAKVHLVLPTAKYFDIHSELMLSTQSIGTTKNGIGYTYSNKALRRNPRVGDLFFDGYKKTMTECIRQQYEELLLLNVTMPALNQLLEPFFAALNILSEFTICDTELYINDALKSGKKVLAEGAQASMLDIDHGTYPFVTSSTTIAAGACTGLGVSPLAVREIFGVTKAYCTRVGNGVFPSEIFGTDADRIREKGGEFGSNTKRPRRIGWLDIPLLKYAVMISGVTKLIVTKADVLSGETNIPICTGYEAEGTIIDCIGVIPEGKNVKPIFTNFEGWDADFSQIQQEKEIPKNLVAYLSFIEAQLGIPVAFLSTGPLREDVIELDK